MQCKEEIIEYLKRCQLEDEPRVFGGYCFSEMKASILASSGEFGYGFISSYKDEKGKTLVFVLGRVFVTIG